MSEEKDETLDTIDIEAKVETQTKDSVPVNMLKLGHFSLSTPSFWITVICILCMFMLLQIGFNIYMYNKMMDKFLVHEEKIVEKIVQLISEK